MKIFLRESRYLMNTLNTNIINKTNFKFFHTHCKNNLKDKNILPFKFFSKPIKTFFIKNLSSPENKVLNIQRSPDNVEYEVVEETIRFMKDKYLVLKSDENYKSSIKILLKFIIFPLRVLSWGGFLWCLYNYYVFPFLLTTLFCGFLEKLKRGIIQNTHFIIDKIYIEKNGTHCEIHTLFRNIKVDLIKIRKLQKEEGIYLKNSIKDMHNNYAPIIIDNNLFLIPKICEIYNHEILNALREGKYLKFKSIIEEKDIIDEETLHKDVNQRYDLKSYFKFNKKK